MKSVVFAALIACALSTRLFFPVIPNGNLNAPTIMVAERASDLILGKPVLKQNVPVWIAPEWEETQRINKPVREA